MFFRKDNIVLIDFLESNKPSKQGKIVEFSSEGIVMLFDGDELPTFIPISNVSEIKLISGTTDSVLHTQYAKKF